MNIEVVESFSAQVAEPGIVTILPEGNVGVRAGAYSSTALSVGKVLERANLPFRYYDKPERLLEQRGAEWFGPTMLIASSIFEVYPDVIKQTLEVIKAHVMQLNSSVENPTVKMTFIINKSEKELNAEICFEGGVDGFSKLLDTIEKVCADKEHE